MSDKDLDQEVMERVKPERRKFLERAAGMGFLLPAITTFSMSGLMARPASAQSNQS